MLPLAGAVADFNFDGDVVDYQVSLSDSRLALGPDNSVHLISGEPLPGQPVRPYAPLRLRADKRRVELLSGQFNLFGSLTPARDEDAASLVTSAVDAMQEKRAPDLLGFMLIGHSATGTQARQFRNIGIFTSVSGVADEEYWANADPGGGSVMRLLQPINAQGEVEVAMPVPATGLLLAVGLAGLWWRRRTTQRRGR